MASSNFLRPFHALSSTRRLAACVVRVLDYSSIPALALPDAPACEVKGRRQPKKGLNSLIPRVRTLLSQRGLVRKYIT